jgi:hypothetical protein
MKYKFCKIEGKYYHSSQCMLVYSENPREWAKTTAPIKQFNQMATYKINMQR